MAMDHRALASLLGVVVVVALCSVLLNDRVLTFPPRPHGSGAGALRATERRGTHGGGGQKGRLPIINGTTVTLEELEQALMLDPGELGELLKMSDEDAEERNDDPDNMSQDEDEDDVGSDNLDEEQEDHQGKSDQQSADPSIKAKLSIPYPNCAALRRKNTPLVTVFTTMHPAKDPLKILAQHNTLQAYKNLAPLVHGLIFTRDRYWQDEARHLGLQVVDDHHLNVFGTPILRDMYRKAFDRTKSYFAVYANADILIGEDFVHTLCAVEHAIRTGKVKNRVMVTGQRLNYELKPTDNITADYADHQQKLGAWSRGPGAELFQVNAEDFFAVNRHAFDWQHMPKYVVGRPGYDNCLVNQAVLDAHVSTIDATATGTALHQTGADGNKAGHKSRPDSEWNRRHCAKGYRKGSVKHCGFYTMMQDGKVTLRQRKNVDKSADLGVNYDDGRR